MLITEHDVVAALGKAIAQRIGEKRYQTWFHGNTRFTWDDGLLIVGVPNHHFQEFLEKRFADEVRTAAGEITGQPATVRFVINPQLFQALRQAQQDVRSREPAPPPEPAKEPEPRVVHARPQRTRRWRRLADFVVGPCNRLAHAAAISVVEAPAEGANPLVIHGPVGTGKTHLLEGIYAGLRKSNPSWRVVYVKAEEFTNRFVQAMRLGKLGSFRKHFRECDALLLDDLHFVAGKPATQEEFMHTFDVLQADGRQLVLTCDCHPKLAGEFTPEVMDRLLSGGVWGLTPPDPQTRLDLLHWKALRENVEISEEVILFLANQLRGNVRELEGCLHSLRHYSRVTGRKVDLALTREALGDLLRHSVRVFQLADIDRAVSTALRLPAGVLQSKKRDWAVSHPRMLAIYLARRHTSATYSEVGKHFGGRNHSTAVAAEKKVRSWLGKSGEVVLGDRRLGAKEAVELIERELLR